MGEDAHAKQTVAGLNPRSRCCHSHNQEELGLGVGSLHRIIYRVLTERIDLITVHDAKRRLPRRPSDLQYRGTVQAC